MTWPYQVNIEKPIFYVDNGIDTTIQNKRELRKS